MRTSLAIALTIASCASPFAAAPVFAQTATPAPANGDPRHFDVAGVRIGMSPAEARAALVGRGYTVGADNTDTMGYSYWLGTALRERNPDHPYPNSQQRVRGFSATGPSGERMVLEFHDTPTGAQVRQVNLSLGGGRTETSGVRQSVMEKYGRPTVARDSLGSAWWCRRSETRCDRVGYTDTVLEFSDVGGITIRLSDENRMRRETDATIAAEVDRRYPRRAASF